MLIMIYFLSTENGLLFGLLFVSVGIYKTQRIKNKEKILMLYTNNYKWMVSAIPVNATMVNPSRTFDMGKSAKGIFY